MSVRLCMATIGRSHRGTKRHRKCPDLEACPVPGGVHVRRSLQVAILYLVGGLRAVDVDWKLHFKEPVTLMPSHLKTQHISDDTWLSIFLVCKEATLIVF